MHRSVTPEVRSYYYLCKRSVLKDQIIILTEPVMLVTSNCMTINSIDTCQVCCISPYKQMHDSHHTVNTGTGLRHRPHFDRYKPRMFIVYLFPYYPGGASGGLLCVVGGQAGQTLVLLPEGLDGLTHDVIW